MKGFSLLILIALCYCVQAQETLVDTLKIEEVSIYPDWSSKTESQLIDPRLVEDPVNQNLAELLDRNTAVYVKSFGLGSLATVSLRGAGANHSNILWNGISLNSSSNGLVDLSLIPAAFLGDASLQMGTSSLSSGTGGLGGALLLNSQSEFGRTERLSFQQQWGSFGRKSSTAQFIVRKKKWYSKSIAYSKSALNNFTYNDIGEPGFPERKLKNAGLDQMALKQDLYYKISESELLGVEFWYQETKRSIPSIFTVNNVIENQEDESIRSLLTYKKYGEKFNLKISTSLLVDELDYENEVAGIKSKTSNTDFKSLVDYDLKLSKTMELNALLNINYSEADNKAYSGKLERKSISLYSDISKEFNKKLLLRAALRQEHIDGGENAFLPNLLVQYCWDESKKWLLQGQLGKNWKYPSLNDLYWIPGGNENLKAEHSSSADLKLFYRNSKLFQNWNVEAEIGAFYSQIDNYIQWRPSAFGYWQASNIGNVESQGTELAIKINRESSPIKKRLWFNYSYIQSLSQGKSGIYDQSQGKQLIYVPEHKYSTTAEIERRGWFLNYKVSFMGARYTSADNQEFLPYYLLSDLGLGKKTRLLNHELALYFSVLNLTDQEYQAIEWRPMPGRNYQVTLSYKLHEK